MRTATDLRAVVVGTSLIAAGTAVAVLGTAALPAAATAALPPIGGSLLGAGVIVLLAAVDLASLRRAVVGAALVAGGVTLTVIGAVAAIATPVLMACGAALVTAGVVNLVHGATGHARATRLTPA